MLQIKLFDWLIHLVFVPGFQKGRVSRLLKEKGREQFWQKKGQFASYKEKLNKMFPISFYTYKTL
jgi:hypothetical protein